jgi:hypothetical protein
MEGLKMSKIYTIKDERIRLDILTVAEYLKGNGYKRISYNDNPNTIVQVENNLVTIVSRDELFGKLMSIAQTDKPKSKHHQTELIEQLTKAASRIKHSIVHLLDELEGEFLSDKSNIGYLFFADKIVEVTPEEINMIEYSESDQYVWAHDKIERNAPKDIPDELTDCNALFFHFVDMLIPYDAENGMDSFASAYGYILHKHKNRTNAKAWIIYDMNIDMDDPEGRTGKTILAESTKYFCEAITEDGKVLKANDKFAFSRVSGKTRIMIIDDVPRNHRFDNYFSLITSDFSIEKKMKNRYAIPFSRSPKLIITSNYNIKGTGGSHKHRRIETVISNHYSKDRTPLDDFGEMFIDWDEEEWERFYSFGILCLKHYLQNGIIEQQPSKEFYLLMRHASTEFVDFAEELELKKVYKKAELLKGFQKNYPDHFSVNQREFTFWLKDYAKYKGHKVRESHSDSISTIEFYNSTDREDSAEKVRILSK